MRRGDKKRVIQEANERLEKRYLNEDVTDGYVIDPMDAHHSKDPAQIDMFTQRAVDSQNLQIQYIIGDDDFTEYLDKSIESIRTMTDSSHFVDAMDAVNNIFDDEDRGNDEKIEELHNELERANMLMHELEDSLSHIKSFNQ